jgi:hypothetical protein
LPLRAIWAGANGVETLTTVDNDASMTE